MSAIVAWTRHLLEWLLLGFGVGCLGMYAYERVEAHRFQAEQVAAFERDAQSRREVSAVRHGSLVGMLDVPRLELSTPVIEGDDSRTLKRAVGHLPDTPMPWSHGNSAIAGHRDGLFRPLKDVKIEKILIARVPASGAAKPAAAKPAAPRAKPPKTPASKTPTPKKAAASKT